LRCNGNNQYPFSLFNTRCCVYGDLLGVKNYTLALKKRKDDLFDRRHAFLRDFEKLWKTTGLESEGATRAVLEWDDTLNPSHRKHLIYPVKTLQNIYDLTRAKAVIVRFHGYLTQR